MTNKSWTILLISGAVVMVLLWAAMNYLASQQIKSASTSPAPTAAEPAATQAEQAVSTSPASSPRSSDIMRLTSSAWPEGGRIPDQFTCDGEDVSPPFAISAMPEGAASLVLIVDDPDAPRGDFVHWTVWNIPSDTAEIAEGRAPAGAVEGTTDFGQPGYGGPCPPSGEHRYQFKLYALDTTLNLSTSAGKKDIEQAMEGHILEQSLLVGKYARP